MLTVFICSKIEQVFFYLPVNSDVITNQPSIGAYGREHIFLEHDDTTAITFYEIAQYDPATFQGKGLTMAVFDTNATGSPVKFDGVMVVGKHEEPNAGGITTNYYHNIMGMRKWDWQYYLLLTVG